MKFRYNLAKKTFKGKKIVERGVEDLIDEDQRGNHSSASAPSPLSLDQETITPVEPGFQEPGFREPEEPKEVSRRDLFSFGRLGDFAEAVEEDRKKQPKKNTKEKTDEDTDESEPSVAEELNEIEPSVSEEEEKPKPGFFKRLVSKFKSDDSLPLEETESPNTESSEKNEESFAETLDTAEKELLTENNIFALEEGEEEDPEYDRRNLIRQGFHFFAKPAVENVQSKIDSVNKAVDKITKRVPVLRPPGAISEKAFLQACSRCDECIHACPKDAIQRAPKKMGFLIHNTPYIDPMRNPCVMCTDLPCIPACPDGALLPVQELSDVSMGYAILDKKKCQAYGDTFCQQCVIDCPVPGAIHQVDEKPIIDKNICTGCGVCMRSCSTVNIPLAIKIKPQMVIDYQLHKKQLEKERVRIEAERLEAERLEAEQLEAEQTENLDAAQENEEAEGETRVTEP